MAGFEYFYINPIILAFFNTPPVLWIIIMFASPVIPSLMMYTGIVLRRQVDKRKPH